VREGCCCKGSSTPRLKDWSSSASRFWVQAFKHTPFELQQPNWSGKPYVEGRFVSTLATPLHIAQMCCAVCQHLRLLPQVVQIFCVCFSGLSAHQAVQPSRYDDKYCLLRKKFGFFYQGIFFTDITQGYGVLP